MSLFLFVNEVALLDSVSQLSFDEYHAIHIITSIEVIR
jgi:hypothetical protein